VPLLQLPGEVHQFDGLADNFRLRLNQRNPLTVGLQVCLVPCGNTFVDLVSGALGVRAGTEAPRIVSIRDGFARNVPPLKAITATNSTDYVQFAASSVLRGALLTQNSEGTLLALAGTTEQVDGNIYSVFGSTEPNINGDGPYLAVDSFVFTGRGSVAAGRFQAIIATSSEAAGLGTSFANKLHLFGYSFGNSGTNWFARGLTTTSGFVPAFGTITADRILWVYKTGSSVPGTMRAYVGLCLLWNRKLSDAEYASLYQNIWQLFEDPFSSLFYVPAGGVTHTTSGALAAQDATLAGTATHLTLHTTSGALAAGTSTIAGTAVHSALHATSGTLSAQASTVVGTAAHYTLHATSGTLAAQESTVAGTAAHGVLHATTGVLNADASTIAGSATHLTLHTTSGALVADASVVSGVAAHTATAHPTTGMLEAGASTVVGTAAHATLHTTSGILIAQAATMAGLATNGAPAPAPTGGFGDLSFDHRPPQERKPRFQGLRDELRQLLEDAADPQSPVASPAASYVYKEAREVLKDTRKTVLKEPAWQLRQLELLQQAIVEVRTELEHQARAKARRRRQQQLLLLED
jgi:hypothetical protein